MDRRTALAVLALAPQVARAQERKPPVVGYLNGFSHAEWAAPLEAFRRGLADSGFAEGRDVAIEYRWANGDPARARQMAAELAGRNVAVIAATGGSRTALEARAATSSVPIVFAMGANPVDIGLARTLNRPGGNVTGVYFLTGELEAKRLGILRELVNASTIGVLVNPTLANAASRAASVEKAAAAVGQRILLVRARDDRELARAFTQFAEQRAGALLVTADPFFLTQRAAIVASAARLGVPTIYEQREFAEAGGLMSYGTNLNDASRECGVCVARILKGEKPADIPVLQSTKFEFVVNVKTARAQRITIPQSVLLRADEVIG
ncbi:MAG: ABC transporter substrate-binding protein [Burkholderiales bacterium]